MLQTSACVMSPDMGPHVTPPQPKGFTLGWRWHGNPCVTRIDSMYCKQKLLPPWSRLLKAQLWRDTAGLRDVMYASSRLSV